MKLYSLIGEKLSHSLSPEIHNYIFKHLDINANYCLMEIKPNNIPNTISSLKTLGYSGINITIPYKEVIMSHLDDLSKEALSIGAVNTVKFEDNRATGYNTDYFGFSAMLEKSDINVCNMDVVVLGGGGAANAIIAFLLDNSVKSLTVISRNLLKLEPLKAQFPLIHIDTYENIADYSGDLIINTTPVGMYPNLDFSPVSEEVICKFKVCADIVYNPLSTKFLQIGKKNNLRTCDGLYMLIGQAIKAEEIFNNIEIDFSIYDNIYDLLKSRF